MADLSQAFDTVAEPDVWTEGVALLGGVAGGILLRRGVDSRFDLPDEAYGIGVIAGAEVAGGMLMGYRRQVQLGGGAFTLMTVAQRSDITSGAVPEA